MTFDIVRGFVFGVTVEMRLWDVRTNGHQGIWFKHVYSKVVTFHNPKHFTSVDTSWRGPVCLKCVAEEMSQPALSELKQRIGFQDGKAGIWMGIDISGFNMLSLGTKFPEDWQPNYI